MGLPSATSKGMILDDSGTKPKTRDLIREVLADEAETAKRLPVKQDKPKR
jgi:hypothetical protein